MLGLPGNAVSAFVTAFLFLLPLIRKMAGANKTEPCIREAICDSALDAGGKRAEFLRAKLDGNLLSPFRSQDSGMTKPLAHANALIIRDIEAAATEAGDLVPYLKADI